MTNSKTVFQELVSSITLVETADEIKSIVALLMESVFGLSTIDIMSGHRVTLTNEIKHTLAKHIERINRREPIQYILGEAHFYGRTFIVSPSVLIPRPETEELVRMVLSWGAREVPATLTILDVGTGSGCIAITLVLECGAKLFASDVSRKALSVAAQNAERLRAPVTLLEHNILSESVPFENLDAIISNPPYIMEAEKSTMNDNVLDFEPHQALFVPDEDPLIFYKAIISKSRYALRPGGLLALEINEKHGNGLSEILRQQGFVQIEILEDIAGKPRIAKAIKPGS